MSKVLEVVGDEIEEATDAWPGTCPVSVREVKIAGLLMEKLIELIVTVLPLLFATVNAPPLEKLSPALMVMATLEVTATLIWACATPATPLRKKAIRMMDQRPG